jgi:hypothetical protein
MDPYVMVYHLHDLETAGPLAAVRPDGAITGTLDGALARTIRDAVRDPLATVYTPDQRMVVGPASRHDPRGRDWAALVCAALARRGLRGVPVGYPRAPAPWDDDPPGSVY